MHHLRGPQEKLSGWGSNCVAEDIKPTSISKIIRGSGGFFLQRSPGAWAGKLTMHKSSISGRSASLLSLFLPHLSHLMPPVLPAPANRPAGLARRLRGLFLAPGQLKLTEFFAAQRDLSLAAMTAALFPPWGAPREFTFEPAERTTSDDEKEVWQRRGRQGYLDRKVYLR